MSHFHCLMDIDFFCLNDISHPIVLKYFNVFYRCIKKNDLKYKINQWLNWWIKNIPSLSNNNNKKKENCIDKQQTWFVHLKVKHVFWYYIHVSMATDSHKVLWYSRWLSPFSSHQVFKFSLIICSWILYKIFLF